MPLRVSSVLHIPENPGSNNAQWLEKRQDSCGEFNTTDSHIVMSLYYSCSNFSAFEHGSKFTTCLELDENLSRT